MRTGSGYLHTIKSLISSEPGFETHLEGLAANRRPVPVLVQVSISQTLVSPTGCPGGGNAGPPALPPKASDQERLLGRVKNVIRCHEQKHG